MANHPALDFSLPRLMAIVNVTPDSFSDGGLLYKGNAIDVDKVAQRLQGLIAEGADIIDIGGESTRPGAAAVSLQEELDRVVPVVEWLSRETDVAISVDTSSPEVMLEAADKGAHLINDVRALSRDGALQAVASTELTVCLMHMQGMPATMQNNPHYLHVVNEVSQYLQERIAVCLEEGITANKIIVDPGFGFGKTLEHNLSLLRQLPEVCRLGFPVLAGMSRKAMIGHLLGRELHERLPASLGLGMLALERGAKILRVHDVAATRDIIDLFVAINNNSNAIICE
ncbi:dihydropteroate synthase [Candidatus Endobugula sertula]|uniref:Dihydropteroate synthase n=1 Tax=Candidatus Endobugula sertula TaxID=62101 RepID=A0A1D2QNA3_9GAMM|nr:dihydropteroate synthase [Candidatus Endobugula sertula]